MRRWRCIGESCVKKERIEVAILSDDDPEKDKKKNNLM